MHGACLDALAATDALRVCHTLVLVLAEGQERIRALENRDLQRELRNAHHRAAHEQLIRGRLKAAAGVDELFDRGADAHFQVFGLRNGRARHRDDTAHDRHAGRKAAVNRAGGIYIEYRTARVGRQLSGRDFPAGARIDELLFCALRVLTLERIQMQARVVLDELLDLGKRVLLVQLDADDAVLGADDVAQHLQAADHFFRALKQQAMVACNVGLALGRIDDDRVRDADSALDLDVGREGRAAMADNAARPDVVDTLVVRHGCEVIRMHRLMQAVLPIVLDDDGHDAAAVRMQPRLNRDDLTRNGCMHRRADKAAGFRDHLAHIDDIALLDNRLCRSADVHGYRQDHLLGSGHRLDRLGVCCGLESGVGMCARMNAATKRVHHFKIHLSNYFVYCHRRARRKCRRRARPFFLIRRPLGLGNNVLCMIPGNIIT